MTSELKVDKITPASGTNTQIGESGDTITIPSGCTITNSGTATNFGASLSGSTNNTVVTVTGANAMQGEANLQFDGSRLGVNNSSMSSYDSNGQDLVVGSHSGSNGITIACGSSGSSNILFATGTTGDQTYKGRIRYNESDNHMGFYTDGDSERIRIRSNGYVGVIKDSGDTYIQRRFSVYGSHVSEDGLVWIQTSNGSGDTNLMLFFDGNTNNCGEITLNATANTVGYNSSSDYRLKQNATSISNGITRLKQLKPYRFQWKSDPDTTVDGFFAHEAQEVVPEAVHGTKDAMKTAENVVINSDGSIECYNIPEADWKQGKIDGKYASDSTWQATKEVIDRQSMDNAKLVPLLTSALQEAITKIETLEAKVAALESA